MPNPWDFYDQGKIGIKVNGTVNYNSAISIPSLFPASMRARLVAKQEKVVEKIL